MQTFTSPTFHIFQTTKEYTYIVCDNFSKLAVTFSQIKKKKKSLFKYFVFFYKVNLHF